MAAPAQGAIEGFIQALRASDLPVSPAEAIDAHRALAAVGFADRTLVKDALCAALAKSAEEAARFDACFETYFARPAFASQAQVAAPELDLPLAQMLLAGDGSALGQAMEAAAARARASEVRLNTQRHPLARRILDEMGLRELEALIQGLRETGAPRDAALAAELAARRETLFAEAGRFVDRQMRLYASETGRRLREKLLAEQKLTAVDPDDMRAMESLVRRMAKRLASRYARKRHRANRGHLDVRKTLRRSMAHGGVPFDIVWKTKTIEKPKIVALCDVSRSMAAAAQFLLLFLFSLNEVVEKLEAFAFSDRLVAVGDILDEEQLDAAIVGVLKRIGFRPTNYGQALEDFAALHLDALDRHTTVIILGDGRSNYADPRLDLIREMAQRSRALIWLNPEPQTYWGQGDSRMDDYRRFCHVAQTCNTLSQLERIIERVLSTYAPQ